MPSLPAFLLFESNIKPGAFFPCRDGVEGAHQGRPHWARQGSHLEAWTRQIWVKILGDANPLKRCNVSS